VNEPVANACRTCGRWPSLLDLEQSTIPAANEPDGEDPFAAQTVDIESPEQPEVIDSDGTSGSNGMPEEFEPAAGDEGDEAPKPPWQRLVRLIVPIGVVVYILITALADR